MSEQERANGARGRRNRRSELSPGKRWLFRAIVALVPFLLLGALEGGLRLAGFGGYPPTFTPVGKLDNGSTLIFSDPAGPVSYFFASRSEGMALDPVAFEMPKPANTIRIMWVGESAAKGIPEPRPLRASAFLQSMLSDLWPDKHVEVLNVGVPGIAAYPVLGIMTESLKYDPDLVVVYLGNNEYYGAYGVASLHSAGRSPMMIRLSRFVHWTAIGQAMSRLLHGGPKHPPGALIEAMVGQDYIGPNDPARKAASHNLETFVGDMVDRCRAKGVPIIVCTPPANESGMAPLGKADLSGLTPSQREEVEKIMASAPAEVASDPASAEASLRRVLELYPQHARALFWLGKALAAQNRLTEADDAFEKAMDLDPMPWRPPSTSVAAIRRAAATRGAIIADFESVFRQASPIGSPGWDLLSDHVHPSLRGQELAARTVVRAMTRLNGPLAVDPAGVDALPDAEAYAQRQGQNIYDTWGVAHKMRLLGSVSMFKDTNPWMLEDNTEVCQSIEANQPPPVVQQLRHWADPASKMVDRYPVTGGVGDAMMQLGRTDEAAHLYRIAAACSTPYSSRRLGFVFLALAAKVQGGHALDETDRLWARESIDEGRFLIRIGQSDSGQAELFVGELSQVLGDFQGSIPYLLTASRKVSGRFIATADRALVLAYVQTGQVEKAREIVRAGLASGVNTGAYREMQGLLR